MIFTKMTIQMVILKMKRNKFHEEQFHDHTKSYYHDEDSNDRTGGKGVSNEEEYQNDDTKDEDIEDNKSVKLSKIIDTNKKQSNDDTENQLLYQEDKNKRLTKNISCLNFNSKFTCFVMNYILQYDVIMTKGKG